LTSCGAQLGPGKVVGVGAEGTRVDPQQQPMLLGTAAHTCCRRGTAILGAPCIISVCCCHLAGFRKPTTCAVAMTVGAVLALCSSSSSSPQLSGLGIAAVLSTPCSCTLSPCDIPRGALAGKCEPALLVYNCSSAPCGWIGCVVVHCQPHVFAPQQGGRLEQTAGTVVWWCTPSRQAA
jgi:hypothetical protein